MDVILDELRRNEVDIDMRTLSYHINDCLERYEFAFRALPIPTESFDIAILFHNIEVINFGRAMVFLSFVYFLKESDEVTRSAVQLIVPLLKVLDLREYKISYFHELFSRVRGFLAL